jgi:hypothetical protein
MDTKGYQDGQIYLKADGATFRYIFGFDDDHSNYLVHIKSHDLGKDHRLAEYGSCRYCHEQRIHMFKKDVLREATPEEYQMLQPLVDKLNKDFEDNDKTERQRILELYSDQELNSEILRRKYITSARI